MKLLDLLRFVESISGMFNFILCFCDWDTEDQKQDVNNHAKVLGNLDVFYHLCLMCWLPHAPSTMIIPEMPINTLYSPYSCVG